MSNKRSLPQPTHPRTTSKLGKTLSVVCLTTCLNQAVQCVVGVRDGFPADHVLHDADPAVVLGGGEVVLEVNTAAGDELRELEIGVVASCFLKAA